MPASTDSGRKQQRLVEEVWSWSLGAGVDVAGAVGADGAAVVGWVGALGVAGGDELLGLY